MFVHISLPKIPTDRLTMLAHFSLAVPNFQVLQRRLPTATSSITDGVIGHPLAAVGRRAWRECRRSETGGRLMWKRSRKSAYVYRLTPEPELSGKGGIISRLGERKYHKEPVRTSDDPTG
jgi:hypothetical protein